MIELSLPFPPSVNHYWGHRAVRVRKTGKLTAVKYLSGKAKDFRKAVADIVNEQFDEPPNLRGSLAVIVKQHYGPDGTPQDIDNCLKPLFDALEHAGVYRDDKQIDELLVVKKRRAIVGRVDVIIKPTGE